MWDGYCRYRDKQDRHGPALLELTVLVGNPDDEQGIE